jgi:hypothetical protein
LPAFVGPSGGTEPDQRREREGHSGGNCTGACPKRSSRLPGGILNGHVG